MFRLLILSTTITMLFISSQTTFAASVTITPTAAGTYSVQGYGMDGVAGIQLDVVYDQASLATPTVTQGGLVAGAMLAANTSRPGFIKIAIVSTHAFSGSGPIATITFASKSASAPLPTVTTSMIDSKGSPLTSSTSNPSSETATAGIISSPGVPFSQPSQQASSSSQQSTATTTSTSTASATRPTYFGTATMPGEQQQRADSQPATSSGAPVNSGEPAAARIAEQSQPSGMPAADTKADETPQYVVFRGISDRFKQYNGSKTLPAMAVLFDKTVAQSISQVPAILLSDGQSKATLNVDIPVKISSSPNFAVNGGKLVSLKQDKQIKGRWIVEVLPDAGAFKVTVTIIAGAEEFEYPLTVAPPVKATLTLDESGWNRFLKEVGTTGAPLNDLNNDGVRDYMDDFIFVANHLVKKTTQTKPALKSEKSVK